MEEIDGSESGVTNFKDLQYTLNTIQTKAYYIKRQYKAYYINIFF